MAITTNPTARCEHGHRPAYCLACLQEWAEHFAWERELDQRIEAARLLGRDASDREYEEWVDSWAPRARRAI